MTLARFSMISLVLLWALPAQALAPQTSETPLYRVELLVFAHDPGALAVSEDFLAEPSAPPQAVLAPVEVSVEARGEEALFPRETETLRLEPVELPARFLPPPPLEPIDLPAWRQRLDTSSGELAALHRRLAAQSGYRPLMHVIWEQRAELDQAPMVIDLAELRFGSSEVAGEARLSRSRFLHLQLDLEFLDPDRGEPIPTALAAMALPEVRLMLPRYRIDESRRMRSGEIHYFDHPAFGVIATVQPIERTPPPR